MREKLIKLIREYKDNNHGSGNILGTVDYLLENGVVVLPCKVGDTVYEIIEDTVPTQHCYVEGYEVQDVSVNAVKYAGDWNQFDYPNLYFTKEEAEKALERSRQ